MNDPQKVNALDPPRIRFWAWGQKEWKLESEFLTISEISQHLNIAESTLYLLVEKRAIPHYRVGRLIRFKLGDVDRWMEGRCRRETTVMEKKKIEISRVTRRPKVNIGEVIQKTIADAKCKKYTSSYGYGKPDLNRESEKGGR